MPLPELDNLVGTGQLKKEPPSVEEFEGLVRSGKARLADAKNTTLAFDSRFDLAYNAAHSLALAALRWHGYRAEKRYVVFETVVQTLQLPGGVRVLSKAHSARNTAEYEGYMEADATLLKNLISAVDELSKAVDGLGLPRA